jgi:hypothetical protein
MQGHQQSNSGQGRCRRPVSALIAAITSCVVGAAFGQGAPDSAALLGAQRDAMKALQPMDGTWRGPAWTLLADGSRHEVTQTERIGPFLGGTIKVIEGRGYEADGRVSFNALAVVSYDTRQQRYNLQSHAQGQSGTFTLTPTAEGYVWTIPTGGETSIRYTAVIRNGELHEVGDRLAPGQAAKRFFEMRLTRIGDSAWPEAGAVPPR